MWATILMILLILTAVFLILLVLVQRGKGGGLSGAFGGMGGQSAFGTKAGDMFTKITIGVSSVWILLCLITVVVLSKSTDRIQPTGFLPPPAAGQNESEPADDGAAAAPEETSEPAPTDQDSSTGTP